jgi:hypothetical protein
MLRARCVDASLHVSRGDETLDVKAPRIAQSSFRISASRDLPGETFRKLSDDVAYLKLSSVTADNVTSHIEAAAGTKGLV